MRWLIAILIVALLVIVDVTQFNSYHLNELARWMRQILPLVGACAE